MMISVLESFCAAEQRLERTLRKSSASRRRSTQHGFSCRALHMNVSAV